jgi:signal transduction histidine kinase
LMTNTRERLLRLVIQIERADIVAVVGKAFAGLPPEVQWGQSSDSEPSLPMDLDATRFESVLLELIHNARQCHQGPSPLSIAISIRLIARGDREGVRLEFADNGPGVPDELKDRIFEQYFSSRPQGERGTGIGLYFARRVVSAHGGTIQEVGTHGQGARFRIDLPRFAACANGSNACSTS